MPTSVSPVRVRQEPFVLSGPVTESGVKPNQSVLKSVEETRCQQSPCIDVSRVLVMEVLTTTSNGLDVFRRATDDSVGGRVQK